MRHDGVEVKVTYEGEQLAEVMDALDFDDRSSLTVWFFDDVTVKLRPCRASQLLDPWPRTESTDAFEFVVEEDWAGERRVLAASTRAPLERDEAARVRASQFLPAGLLTSRQVDYLADCAPIRVNPAGLVALGPIEATRWKKVDHEALTGLKVRAERWRLPGLEFLELSNKVQARGDAAAAQRMLESALTGLGLPPNRGQDTKTRRVLERLAPAPNFDDSPTRAGGSLADAVVFFDIGDTLAGVTVSPAGDAIIQFDVGPGVPAALAALRDAGARIGIISNRGFIPTAAVNQALREAGLMEFIDPGLIVYGPKDTPLVFEQAATLTGDRTRRVYVGEDTAERTRAARAGYLVATHPDHAMAMLTPPSP
jgi:hypothetical protein